MHLPTTPETKDRKKICDLPDDLLVEILLLVPAKDAVATTILSKRWRHVWTMLPELTYIDNGSVWCFIEESLKLHKAPILKNFTVELGPRCPSYVNVETWIENTVNRGLSELDFDIDWTAEPTRLPIRFYTCETLVYLALSNKILLDVSSHAYLPSLKQLVLIKVVYKDENSLVKFLASSPVLEELVVQRYKDDNLLNVIVKVPTLKILCYLTKEEDNDLIGMLVIDCPALTHLYLIDYLEYSISIKNLSCLDVAFININQDQKIMSFLSSVKHLTICLNFLVLDKFSNINFTWLTTLNFYPEYSLDWLKSLMFLLRNSPKLKTLLITTGEFARPHFWNQPDSIPVCLSSHLEILRWKAYGGQEDEKELVEYIFANSKCIEKIDISIFSDLEETQKETQREELKVLPRISTSSKLIFHDELEWDLFYIGMLD